MQTVTEVCVWDPTDLWWDAEVMVNFMSQFDCTMGCLDVLLNIIFQCICRSVSG